MMKNVYTLFVGLLVLVVITPSKAQILESDSLALVDIYNASGGNWSKTWLKETIDGNNVGIKGWEGVTVVREEGEEFYRVTEIDIEGINNDGIYPSGTLSPSIGNLSALTLLYLNGSEKGPRMLDLHGSIPEELWDLANLKRLRVKYTNLTGGFPIGIEKMTSLEYINFQKTNLNCEIPKELFELPALQKVYLQQCNLFGDVPSTLTSATQLDRLYIHENKLTSLPFVEISNVVDAKVSLEGNYFTYSEVAPYHSIAYLKFVDSYQYAQNTESYDLNEGDEITFEVGDITGGDIYNWYKLSEDEDSLEAAILKSVIVSENTQSYTISSVDENDLGIYLCRVEGDLEDFELRAFFNIKSVSVTTDVYDEKYSVVLAPNPFDNYINLTADSEIQSVAIYSATGKMVLNVTQIYSDKHLIPTSQLRKGVYILRAETASGVITKKILKR